MASSDLLSRISYHIISYLKTAFIPAPTLLPLETAHVCRCHLDTSPVKRKEAGAEQQRLTTFCEIIIPSSASRSVLGVRIVHILMWRGKKPVVVMQQQLLLHRLSETCGHGKELKFNLYVHQN